MKKEQLFGKIFRESKSFNDAAVRFMDNYDNPPDNSNIPKEAWDEAEAWIRYGSIKMNHGRKAADEWLASRYPQFKF